MMFKRRFSEAKDLFTKKKDIELCINRLIMDGYLSPEKGSLIKENLSTSINQSKYILFNLGAHMSIGAVFAFDIIPLPMGTISRVLWVIGNRIYIEFKRDKKKRKIHSLPVLLVSLIPWVGYFAYTLPLKKYNADVAYVYANQITYMRKEVFLVKYLEGKPRIVKWALKRLLIPEDINKYIESQRSEGKRE